MRRPRRSASSAVAAIALLCVLVSCGTSSTPSQTSPPPTTAAPATTAASSAAGEATAAACEDVAALKASLEALTKVRPVQDGVGALRTAIANVKTNLDTAEASAGPVLKPSVEQVKTAFDALQTAASGLTADNVREKAPSIASAMVQVVAATRALSSALADSCPGN